MYNIAVIENETELQRYGHANVIRNLTQALKSVSKEAKYYKLFSFTSANINDLFFSGVELFLYDSIFISTNACSDATVYAALQNNADSIIKFIESGRGIYVGYQKKLNERLDGITSVDAFETLVNDTRNNGPFSFLPESYRFRLIEEYNLEEDGKFRRKDSWEGDVQIEDRNRFDVVLAYPNNIYHNDILKRCKNNDFQYHIYKSSIYPVLKGSYETLLFDNSPDDKRKRILLARSISKKNERIIASSMALDWENHGDLLVNIIEYITKGVPKHAFILSDKDEKNSDFNYLVNSAIISKTPCAVYNDVANISAVMQSIHDVYFFSPSISETEVTTFWGKLKKEKGKKKVYHLLSHATDDDELVLKQYSNSSSLENIKLRAATWLDEYYALSQKGNWDGFWVTYDVLMMMKRSSLEYESYLERIYEEMIKHCKRSPGYDELIGCTIGMLELLYEFWPDKVKQIKETQQWIFDKIFNNDDSGNGNSIKMPISDYEKESFLLTFYKLSKSNLSSEIPRINLNTDRFVTLIEHIYNNLILPQSEGINCTEIELCRHLQFCVFFDKPYDKILDSIIKKRDSDGKWIGVGRTSGVIIYLLSVLSKETILNKNLNKKLEESINYILSQLNQISGNWNALVLDTARAIHALTLYDEMFSLTTKDFFETVQREAIITGYNNTISNAFNLSTELQRRIFLVEQKERDECNKLAESQAQLKKIEDENHMLSEKAAEDRKIYERRWRIVTAISLFSSLIVVCLIIFICIDLKQGLRLVSQVGSLIGLTVSLVLSFVVEEILHRHLFPESRKNKRKHKNNPKKGDIDHD